MNRRIFAALLAMLMLLPLVAFAGEAEALGVSPGYLSSLFSRYMPNGFAECLNRIRVERAWDYFVDGRMKTYEVAYRVASNEEKYFSNAFKKIMGVSPSQYRKQEKEP